MVIGLSRAITPATNLLERRRRYRKMQLGDSDF